MDISIRSFEKSDAAEAAEIWNRVIEDGVAFPQLDFLDKKVQKNSLKIRISPE